MEKLTVYGLPLNPKHLLETLDGASFCISYFHRSKLGKQLDDAIRLVGEDQILLVDNGAYSLWQNSIKKTGKPQAMSAEYIEGYEAWANDILERCPQAIAVVPDVIGGTVEANVELLETTMLDTDRAMVIWHMHEPISLLIDYCERYPWIGIGSTVDKPGCEAWHARMREAFAAIDAWDAKQKADNEGLVRPRIHLMRAQQFAHLYPVDSSDSTNVAVNHKRQLRVAGETVAQTAARIDRKIQSSAGPAAEHQIKRPLLEHLDDKAWLENVYLEQQMRAAGYTAIANQMLEDRYARSIARCDAMHERLSLAA